MTLYKLTDSDGETRGGMIWSVGMTNSAAFPNKPAELCTNTVLHAYTSPLLAALMNPAHGDFQNPLCFTVEGEVVVTDGTKVGCRSLTVTGTFDLPPLTTIQRVAFGIYCALEVYKEPSFMQWAENWLNGSDRSKESADSAADSAAADSTAAYAAAYAATTTPAAWYASTATTTASKKKNMTIDFQDLAEKALTVV